MNATKDDIERLILNRFSRIVERMPMDGDGIYRLPKCKPELCCQVNPLETCIECKATLCKDCIDKLYGLIPPWEMNTVFCGAWVI
jgi:hypothetical protein